MLLLKPPPIVLVQAPLRLGEPLLILLEETLLPTLRFLELTLRVLPLAPLFLLLQEAGLVAPPLVVPPHLILTRPFLLLLLLAHLVLIHPLLLLLLLTLLLLHLLLL